MLKLLTNSHVKMSNEVYLQLCFYGGFYSIEPFLVHELIVMINLVAISIQGQNWVLPSFSQTLQ